ncbi:MAG: polyhydroxyalkanoate biosynthesis repressor PhaR [Candidatus Marinimicrobia bacterium]|nr:polyhydroxyalkanoate biosynthesis repressor PhaR [Candidatus Neomarinimicrobiota bacterium]|tara:strand:+ start:9493 stop:10536 length:1044 start_codon:yes stop_codon:yes gene_type:complete
MVKSLFVGTREIGPNFLPLVVAEIGINHNGSLEVAKKMVDAAVGAGIEVIKHQTHIVEDEMSMDAKQVIPGNSDQSIYKIMEDCSLNEKEEFELQEYVEKKGAIFISTPFSRAAADRLEKMEVPAFKIGSGECNNYPLIEHISDFGKPIILSTGMNNIHSVSKAVKIIKEKKVPYALMHTTNIYPTPNNLVRLGAMTALQDSFPNCPIGLSDHTLTNHACFGAIALGASILERHFTDTMEREGPDICCSMDPDSARELLEGVEILFQERGGKKEALEEERATIDFAFSTVVSIKPIQKGDLLSKENIWVKRPGTGEILAEDYNKILGKKALRKIPHDTHLSWEDFEN